MYNGFTSLLMYGRLYTQVPTPYSWKLSDFGIAQAQAGNIFVHPELGQKHCLALTRKLPTHRYDGLHPDELTLILHV